MDVYRHVEKRLATLYPDQTEFSQAVLEVTQDIAELYRSKQSWIDANIIDRVIEPDRIIQFRVVWEDDQHKVNVNRAWRVQFNNTLGAYKGGIRFHPSVNESIFKFLGFEQCFKNALTGLPMGGGKGGSDFDPKGRSDREIMRFCYAFMDELHRHIGEQTDVPAGDIGVGSREIGYMFGRYVKLENRFTGTLTGKGPNFGGSCGRVEATGFGVVYMLENVLAAHSDGLEGKSVIISGSGNVALYAARKCLEKGATVLSLSDSRGCLYFADGLTIEQLESIQSYKIGLHRSLDAWYEAKGSAAEQNSVEYRAGETPWSIKADIALPCATQNEIDAKAACVLADNGLKVLLEGANMPVTAEAQDVLIDRSVIFMPGKASNAGGVAVSGFERTQNASMLVWSLEEVDEKLQTVMQSIHSKCIEHIDCRNGRYHYRKGANLSSFEKLADAMTAFGL